MKIRRRRRSYSSRARTCLMRFLSIGTHESYLRRYPRPRRPRENECVSEVRGLAVRLDSERLEAKPLRSNRRPETRASARAGFLAPLHRPEGWENGRSARANACGLLTSTPLEARSDQRGCCTGRSETGLLPLRDPRAMLAGRRSRIPEWPPPASCNRSARRCGPRDPRRPLP